MPNIIRHAVPGALPGYEFTDPSVLAGIAAGASWADPTMDPTSINWAERQRNALIPFEVVDGRPVSPAPTTGIRYGRHMLGHWGEQQCADALVIAHEHGSARRWLLLIERTDGHGWACPGGYVDQGETPEQAAIRELREETGLCLDGRAWTPLPARVVPDPRASDEAWMVTVPVVTHLAERLPVEGGDDARRAVWVPAPTYRALVRHLDEVYAGGVFAAHVALIADVLR